jgi:hypothetical protein
MFIKIINLVVSFQIYNNLSTFKLLKIKIKVIFTKNSNKNKKK